MRRDEAGEHKIGRGHLIGIRRNGAPASVIAMAKRLGLRYVAADDVSTMAFAPQKRIAAVMSFSQDISPDGEVDMIETTERLIERVVALDGAFYLPYRLHARRDQVQHAYARTAYFIERKRLYDPGLLFRNAMWDAYFA